MRILPDPLPGVSAEAMSEKASIPELVAGLDSLWRECHGDEKECHWNNASYDAWPRIKEALAALTEFQQRLDAGPFPAWTHDQGGQQVRSKSTRETYELGWHCAADEFRALLARLDQEEPKP